MRKNVTATTIPYSECLVTYVEYDYEHGVTSRLEHGIRARSIEYGFITSAPDMFPLHF